MGTARRLDPQDALPGTDGYDPGVPLNIETFTKALNGLRHDINDKLESKIDTSTKVLRSEIW